ncbi:MAG: protoporphyrinogen oxidase [Terriglobia bacterium]
MPQDTNLRVAVIGGGITGLAAMHALAQARKSGAAVEEVLIEAGERLGGVIQTEQLENFVIEAGPDSFLTEKPEARLLCEELGLGDELMGSNDHVRRTYVLHRGRLAPLPGGLMFFVPGRPWSAMLSPLLPIASKAALIREFLRRPESKGGIRENEDDESVAEFVRRHFGVGLLENIVQPLLAGVYGADPEELSARAVLPRFLAFEREHGSVVRGALKASKQRKDNNPVFTTLRGGLGDLIQALSARLGLGPGRPRCDLGARVIEFSVREPERGAALSCRKYTMRCESGSTHKADAVILALPGCDCARLLEPLRPGLSMALDGISYAPAITVALAFRTAPNLPPGFGFLVPRAERGRLLACTFVHFKFSSRVPADGALLRCFLGGSRSPQVMQWSDEEIMTAVTRELRAALGFSQQADFYRVFRWPNALPRYSVGHENRVREIRQQLEGLPGIFLAGNAYAGVGVPDCIRSGRAAAKEVLRYAEGFR